MSTERRHIRYKRLVKAGCSREQIRALMQPGAPTLWRENEHGQLFPLDGVRETGKHWYAKILRKAVFKVS